MAQPFGENLSVMLAHERGAADDSPWRTSEFARRPRHPDFPGGWVNVVDEKLARPVLFVARNFAWSVNREARHVLRLGFFKSLVAALGGQPVDESGLDRICARTWWPDQQIGTL